MNIKELKGKVKVDTEKVKSVALAGVSGILTGVVTGVCIGAKLKGRDIITTREVLIVQPEGDLELDLQELQEDELNEENWGDISE